MPRKCTISGTIRQAGHRVSHAKNRTKHMFDVNLQTRKFLVEDPSTPGVKRSVRLRLSTRMLRTIDKIGLDQALRQNNMSISDLL